MTISPTINPSINMAFMRNKRTNSTRQLMITNPLSTLQLSRNCIEKGVRRQEEGEGEKESALEHYINKSDTI
jgi:hypothetical protein